MGLLELSNKEATDLHASPLSARSYGFVDAFKKGLEAVQAKRFSDTVDGRFEKEIRLIDLKYRQVTGKGLLEKVNPRLNLLGGNGETLQAFNSLSEENVALLDAELLNMKAGRQGEFDGFESFSALRQKVFNDAQKEMALSDEQMRRISLGTSSFTEWTGKIVGSLSGGLVDPVNIVATLGGAGLAKQLVSTGASVYSNVARMMFAEGASNVMAEAIQHPSIQEYNRQLGREYGMGDFAANAGWAFLFGAGFGGLGAAGFAKFDRRGFNAFVQEAQTTRQLHGFRDLGKNPDVEKYFAAIRENPYKYARMAYESELGTNGRAFFTDFYREVRDAEVLHVLPKGKETMGRVFSAMVSGKPVPTGDSIDLMLHIDEVLRHPKTPERGALQLQAKQVFAPEIQVLDELKPQDLPISYLDKLMTTKRTSELTSGELTLARRMGWTKGKRINKEKIRAQYRAIDDKLKAYYGSGKVAPREDIADFLARKIAEQRLKLYKPSKPLQLQEQTWADMLTPSKTLEAFHTLPTVSPEEVIAKLESTHELPTPKPTTAITEELESTITELRDTNLMDVDLGGGQTFGDLINDIDLDVERLKSVAGCAKGGVE